MCYIGNYTSLIRRVLEAVMRAALRNNPLAEVRVNFYGEVINNLILADNINLIADTEEHPQQPSPLNLFFYPGTSTRQGKKENVI